METAKISKAGLAVIWGRAFTFLSVVTTLLFASHQHLQQSRSAQASECECAQTVAARPHTQLRPARGERPGNLHSRAHPMALCAEKRKAFWESHRARLFSLGEARGSFAGMGGIWTLSFPFERLATEKPSGIDYAASCVWRPKSQHTSFMEPASHPPQPGWGSTRGRRPAHEEGALWTGGDAAGSLRVN